MTVNGYVHHASKDEPQYFIKSDKAQHVAIHKGQALTRIKAAKKSKSAAAKGKAT